MWPADDGWPYPDSEGEVVDLDADVDDDLLQVKHESARLLDDLDPLERRVISALYGLSGQPTRSFQQLHDEWGVPDDDLRSALGSGLGKLRMHLA